MKRRHGPGSLRDPGLLFLELLLQELPSQEGGIDTLPGQKGRVSATLHDLPFVENQDLVRIHDGRHPVADDEGGAAGKDLPEVREDFRLRMSVHSAQGVVEDQDGRIPGQGPGQGSPLFLSSGKVDAPFSEKSGIPVGKARIAPWIWATSAAS